MTPEFIEYLKTFPDISEENVKKLFIRDISKSSYDTGEIKANTERFSSEIKELIACNLSKEEIGLHIANLEKARGIISSMIQGYKKGYFDETEPKIKEKQVREAKEKRISSGKLTIDDLREKLAAIQGTKETPQIQVPIVNRVTKTLCPKCNKEVISLKFHSC